MWLHWWRMGVRQASGQRGSAGRATVLVVDDSPEFLEVMRELLETDGYAVATCRWAEDAPTRIRQLRPDLLILDVRMLGVEDWTVVDQIKADPELAQIPCLVA